jgi:hypothetical protein
MANLIDAASWTDNEVYKIAETDLVEGSHPGGSFSGLGVDNQPHQQLANRTSFLKSAFDAMEASFILHHEYNSLGPFTLMPVNGYLKLPVQDTGVDTTLALQWGSMSMSGLVSGVWTMMNATPALNFTGVLNRCITAWAWAAVLTTTTATITVNFCWVPANSNTNRVSFLGWTNFTDPAGPRGGIVVANTCVCWAAIGPVN